MTRELEDSSSLTGAKSQQGDKEYHRVKTPEELPAASTATGSAAAFEHLRLRLDEAGHRSAHFDLESHRLEGLRKFIRRLVDE